MAPVTAAMLYVKVPAAQRLVVVPVMVPGWAVLDARLRDLAVEDPQAEFAVTVTEPETKVEGYVTEMAVVP